MPSSYSATAAYFSPRDAGTWAIDGDTMEIQWDDKDGKPPHTERLKIVDNGQALLSGSYGKHVRQNAAQKSGNALGISKETLAFANERNSLPADKQIAATLAKLKAVNRGDDIHANIGSNSDGTLHVDIVNQDSIFGIEPLYGLKISRLNLGGCRYLKSLNGVQGMPLTELKLPNCSGLEGDLSALAGMKLTKLEIRGCEKLTSLKGLEGMPLTDLDMNHCYAVEDISPLKGMRLTKLDLHQCQNLKTLSGIEGMPLNGKLDLGNCYNLQGDLSRSPACS